MLFVKITKLAHQVTKHKHTLMIAEVAYHFAGICGMNEQGHTFFLGGRGGVKKIDPIKIPFFFQCER